MVRKKDPFWKYVVRVDGKVKCTFCDKKFAGGAPRVKSHLSGKKSCGIDICTKVPDDVRVAAAEAISDPKKKAKTEVCSGKSEETSPKMLMSNDSIMLDELLAKLIMLNDLDVDVVRRKSFIDFVNGVAEHGSRYKLPRASVVQAKLVPDLEKQIGEYVAKVKKSWDTTGCTIMFDIWSDKQRSFINIFAHSIEGIILLDTLDMPSYKLRENSSPWEFINFVTQEIRANNIVQYIINGNEEDEEFFEIVLNKNHPHVYRTHCVAYGIDVLFEKILDKMDWVAAAFAQASEVFTSIHELEYIFFPCNWKLRKLSRTEFYSSYYMLQSVMGVESELLSSSECLPSQVGDIIHSSEFWSEGKEVLHALEPIFQVLCLVDSYSATAGFLYAAVERADEAIRQIYETNIPMYESLWEVFKEWKREIIHPIHAAAAFLNPAYMCSVKFIENDAMKHGMDFILEKLVGGEEKEKFTQEMALYRNEVPKLFAHTTMTMSRTSHPCDWWDCQGHALPVLKKYAIQILSQPCSTSFFRQSLSAFRTAQIDERKTENILYLRTNALLMENFNTMKEKIRKPLDLDKLSDLPNLTDYIDEDFTPDLLNETKILSVGYLNFWSAAVRKHVEREKHWRLHFITKLPSSLVKGSKFVGERGGPIHVIMVDSSTGRVVQSASGPWLWLTVTVVGGDFDEEAGKNWTRLFFESNEIKGREGNMPLLTGDLCVRFDESVGTLGDITFNDVSSWTRSGKFRLGVKTTFNWVGFRVHEGISDAFAVEGVEMAGANNFGDRIQMLGGAPTFPGQQLLRNPQRTSSVEPQPSFLSLMPQLPYCQIGNETPVVSGSSGDAQEAACRRANDTDLLPASTSHLHCLDVAVTTSIRGLDGQWQS